METATTGVHAERTPSFLLATPEKRVLSGSPRACRAGSCPTT